VRGPAVRGKGWAGKQGCQTQTATRAERGGGMSAASALQVQVRARVAGGPACALTILRTQYPWKSNWSSWKSSKCWCTLSRRLRAWGGGGGVGRVGG
jgi:hypothetical protein